MKPFGIVLGCALGLGVHAATESLPKATTAPKRIAVFKNGLGFVVRSGEVRPKGGEGELDSLPAAALGALWISTDDPAKRVLEISSVTAKERVPVDSVNFPELLRANIGASANITYSAGGNSGFVMIQGEILAVPEDRRPPEIVPVEFRGFIPPTLAAEAARGEIVVVRTPNGETVAINANTIQSVRLQNAELKTALERDVTRTRVRFVPEVEQADLSMMYLQKGWNWSPSYLVDIANEQEAQISLEAVLANDVEDLRDADISFVVGYPNFAFSDVSNLLSSRQSIAQFLQALLAHGQDRPQLDYAIMAQNSVAYSGRGVLESDSFSPAALSEGQVSEDLFFYERPKVTLTKGGRARFVLLSARVPYEHVYQWDLKEDSREPWHYRPQDPTRAAERKSEVWHTLRIANTTQQPWTTAPAFTVNRQLPVAQDTLKYTPPGATNSLKITVASDIRANQVLTELSREQVSILGSSHMKVAVQSRLTVQNLKNKPVKIAINREVLGEVLDPGGAKARKIGQELNALNPANELVWEFPLAAGEQMRIEFKYSTIATR